MKSFLHLHPDHPTAICLLIAAVLLSCDSAPVHYPSAAPGPAPRVENPEWRPIDADKPTMAKLGKEALDGLGYDEIIRRAEQAGWIKTVRVVQAQSPAQKVLIADAATAAAGGELVKLFTKYALAAGLTAQADSPAPGPADFVAVGIIVFGLMHVGYLKAEEILVAQQAQAATASAIPTATATTTTTAPPIAVPRKYPGQTCDNARLKTLQKEKDVACISQQWTCRDSFERIGWPGEKLLTCAELLARIAIGRACLAARQRVQDECFAGSTDAAHAGEIKKASDAIEECMRKAAIRGPEGGPCKN